MLGMAGTASAGFVPVFVSEMTTANSSVFVYNVSFSSNGSTESLASGDFFTLEDVGPLAAVSITSGSSFSFTQQFTGTTAPFTAPPDSASILNLTATYTGPTLLADTMFTATITVSGIVGTKTGYYSSTDSITSGKNSQAGFVTLPGGVVPEPSTYAALALGSVALGVVALRRRTA